MYFTYGATRADRDALIAASALVHNLTVATRNAQDLEPTGVKIFNPLEHSLTVSHCDLLQQPADSESNHETSPVFSPDGEQIAFVSDRNGEQLDIYVMAADGSDVQFPFSAPLQLLQRSAEQDNVLGHARPVRLGQPFIAGRQRQFVHLEPEPRLVGKQRRDEHIVAGRLLAYRRRRAVNRTFGFLRHRF